MSVFWRALSYGAGVSAGVVFHSRVFHRGLENVRKGERARGRVCGGESCMCECFMLNLRGQQSSVGKFANKVSTSGLFLCY